MLRCSPQLTAGRSGGDRTHSGGTGRDGPAARAARGRWCPQSRPGRPQRRRGRPKPGTSRGRRGPFTLLAVKTRRTRARAALVSRGWAAGLGGRRSRSWREARLSPCPGARPPPSAVPRHLTSGCGQVFPSHRRSRAGSAPAVRSWPRSKPHVSSPAAPARWGSCG